MLYVMLSRVREASKYRSLQLSKKYDKSKLLHLRPRIGAVKWRIDVGDDGKWMLTDGGNSMFGIEISCNTTCINCQQEVSTKNYFTL
jgi:hypothetical protein